jgi:hypothetical protein
VKLSVKNVFIHATTGVAELNIGVFSLLVLKCPVKLSVKNVFIYATTGVAELNIGVFSLLVLSVSSEVVS